MTDKQVIIDCKYKFQNNEKFEGKPYCTLHNELCEDLSFACDDNCQIYDDYKQLVRKTQECEELRNKLACQININNHLADYQVTANKLMDCYSKALEEIEDNINKYFEEGFYKNCRYAKECTKACGLATNRVLNKTLDIINKAKGEGDG